MTQWKIAIETEDEGGLVTEVAPDAVAHAFDVDGGEFPHPVSSPYALKRDVDWEMPLQRGKRCTVCADMVAPSKEP
ncbi:hypothetical protein [Streptomyces sp. NPDC046939]|uniref:hypothetical protein n=1 Tax=Streptomyces sp. NPDC046939 TaxID=3155376 RepID=UPI0033D06BF5